MENIKDLSSPCIEWSGSIDEDGYGRIQHEEKWKLAHRFVFEKQFGRIVDGMVIDHLCRNRNCVNVMHMDVVTPYENLMRGNGVTALNAMKLYCKYGHRLSGANLGTFKKGGRFCRECQRRRWREYRARKIKNGNLS